VYFMTRVRAKPCPSLLICCSSNGWACERRGMPACNIEHTSTCQDDAHDQTSRACTVRAGTGTKRYYGSTRQVLHAPGSYRWRARHRRANVNRVEIRDMHNSTRTNLGLAARSAGRSHCLVPLLRRLSSSFSTSAKALSRPAACGARAWSSTSSSYVRKPRIPARS